VRRLARRQFYVVSVVSTAVTAAMHRQLDGGGGRRHLAAAATSPACMAIPDDVVRGWSLEVRQWCRHTAGNHSAVVFERFGVRHTDGAVARLSS